MEDCDPLWDEFWDGLSDAFKSEVREKDVTRLLQEAFHAGRNSVPGERRDLWDLRGDLTNAMSSWAGSEKGSESELDALDSLDNAVTKCYEALAREVR